MDLPIIREKKSRETKFPKVRPLFGPFRKISAKISDRYALSWASFELMRPNIWPAGNTGLGEWLDNNCTIQKNLIIIFRKNTTFNL